MRSERQIETSRRNGAKGRGPTTRKGRARVGLNALKTGAFSRKSILPGEDEEAFRSLLAALGADSRSEEIGHYIARFMLGDALWKKRRLDQVGAGILEWNRLEILAQRARRKARSYDLTQGSADEPIIEDKEKYHKAMARARKMRALQKKKTPTLGLAFMRGEPALATVASHAAHVDASIYRALKHLQLGQRAPLPRTLNLTVTGGAESELNDRSGEPQARST